MDDTKRQKFPPGLWVVSTPIGNLSDLSIRARVALQEAEIVLCEDTRRTATLLSALEIEPIFTRLRRFDAHTQAKNLHYWVNELISGVNIALVTDAGTPAISDPGSALIGLAQERGVRITPVPGPSAVLTLLSISGFNETAFAFLGFFPRKKNEQEKVLKLAEQSQISRVFVWFESPNRIRETLKTLVAFSPSLTVVVGKELTKLHEQVFYGTGHHVFQRVSEVMGGRVPLGEWCFAVVFSKNTQTKFNENSKTQTEFAWITTLKCLYNAGVSASEAVKEVSQQFGIPKKITYEATLEIFGKKNAKKVDPI